jgi:hypothetical protein
VRPWPHSTAWGDVGHTGTAVLLTWGLCWMQTQHCGWAGAGVIRSCAVAAATCKRWLAATGAAGVHSCTAQLVSSSMLVLCEGAVSFLAFFDEWLSPPFLIAFLTRGCPLQCCRLCGTATPLPHHCHRSLMFQCCAVSWLSVRDPSPRAKDIKETVHWL